MRPPRSESVLPYRRVSFGLVGVALALLAAGCGARSGLDCFGERCALTGTLGSPDAGLGADGAIGRDGIGNAPPVVIPPRDVGVEPPEVPPDVPVDQPSTGCDRDGRFRGSLVILSPEQLRQLEGCREVDGDLIISGLNVDDLSELGQLRRVGGTLELSSLTLALSGLENLQSVNNLTLESLNVPSLAPLASLRQIGSNPLDEDAGRLAIARVDGPLDLNGLGSIGSLRSLDIDRIGTIRSLSGLLVPAAMTSVKIASSPGLTDIVGLDQLIEVEVLQLSGLGIRSVLGLQNMARAGSVAIIDMLNLIDLTFLGPTSVDVFVLENTAVENLDALALLRSVENVVISRNPSLTDLDGLSQLEALTELSVLDNANLVVLPDLASVGVMEQLILRRNPLLASGPGFPSLVEVGLLEVSDNPALTEVVGFTALSAARRIHIRRNASLTNVDLSQLSAARTLNISCNPVLPESSVEGLAGVSGSAVISGNQGSATPCAEPL